MSGVLLLVVALLRVFAYGQKEIAPSSRHLSGTKLPRVSALVFNEGITGSISLTHMASSYGVVCYQDVSNNNSGTCSGLMLSGMELSKGSDSIFNTGDTNFISITCFDRQYQQACTVCYEDAVSVSQGACNAYRFVRPGPAVHLNSVAQASDVSISFVSSVHFSDVITVSCHQAEGQTGVGRCIGLRHSGLVLEKIGQFDFSSFAVGAGHESWISVASFSETAGIVCYHDESSSSFGRCTAFDFMGAALTQGASVDFNVGMTTHISVARFTGTYGVVCYQDGDNGNRGICKHLLVAGMTPICGADVMFEGGATYFISVARLSDTSGIVCYQDGANGLGKCTGLDIVGNSVFKAGDFVFSSGSATSISVAGFADMIGVVCYQDVSNSKHGTCTAVPWPALTNSTTTTTTTPTTSTTTTTTHPTTATASSIMTTQIMLQTLTTAASTIPTTKTPVMTPLSSHTTTRTLSATTSLVNLDDTTTTTTLLDASGSVYAASATLTISTFLTTTTVTSTTVITVLQASQPTIASTTPAVTPTTMQPRLSTTTTSLTTPSLSLSSGTSFASTTIVYKFTTSTTTSTPQNISNATAPIAIAQRVVSQDVTLGIPLTIGLSCLACLALALWWKQCGEKRKPINSDHKGCPPTLAPADDLSDIVIDCELSSGTLCSGSGEKVEAKLYGLSLPLDMVCNSPLSMKHVATPSTEASSGDTPTHMVTISTQVSSGNESSSTAYSGLTHESPSLVFSPRTESSETHYLEQFTAPEDAAALEVPHNTSIYEDGCWQGQSSDAAESAFWEVLPSTSSYERALDDHCIAPVNPSANTVDALWSVRPVVERLI